ncbi:MAG TPA: EAL domain-containing protein [Pilimelia sp.]|nr:EAL domain-containing protein [Pilimelia sp.]
MGLRRRVATPASSPATIQQVDAASPIGRIIAERAIFPRFQPIVDLATRKIVGVEALARGPAGSALEFPDALFPAAIRAGLLAELDMLCAERAIEVARDAGPLVPSFVFVNVEPAVLHQPPSATLLDLVHGGLRFRLVLEITERALSGDPAALLRFASGVHHVGNSLALDDVGADPLSLAFVPLVEPEVVKLDMHLLRSPYSPETVRTATTVAAFAERTGAAIVAEGVETEEDAGNALALGARWGQGWLFGRPGSIGDLAGRPVERAVRLRPPQRGLHLPAGTPFTTASTRSPVRSVKSRMVAGLIEHVVGQAAASGPHAVVLCALSGPDELATWSAPLAALSERVAYVGLLTDSELAPPAAVRAYRLNQTDPIQGETTIAVVGPYLAAAACVRRRPRAGDGEGECDVVLTYDRDLVQEIARMLMRRVQSR